ncbi:MAG: DNA repair protein RecO [Candidatus Aminicenantaceae bacterium]
MPLNQSEAIVLRSFNVGDQDKIVVFFSHDKGVIKGIAKGARKFGNRFGSSLEPMSLVRIFYYEKERKDLVTISNCDLLESFFEIQQDLKIVFTLSYFTELVEAFFPTRSKEVLIYRLLLSVLRALKEGRDSSFLTHYFEAWFLKINGIMPNFAKCKRCQKKISDSSWLSPKKDGAYCNSCAPQKKEKVGKELSLFLQWVRKNSPSHKGDIPFTPQQLKAIRKILQEIIIYHLEVEPKTLRHLNK